MESIARSRPPYSGPPRHSSGKANSQADSKSDCSTESRGLRSLPWGEVCNRESDCGGAVPRIPALECTRRAMEARHGDTSDAARHSPSQTDKAKAKATTDTF